ncbi:MAG: hypothetical protein WB755_21680 [Terriglobales bacterium]
MSFEEMGMTLEFVVAYSHAHASIFATLSAGRPRGSWQTPGDRLANGSRVTFREGSGIVTKTGFPTK